MHRQDAKQRTFETGGITMALIPNQESLAQVLQFLRASEDPNLQKQIEQVRHYSRFIAILSLQ